MKPILARSSPITAAVVLLLLAFPLVVSSPRYLYTVNIALITIVLALGMYSMWSIGLLSAAHPAFWGIGAYGSALLMMKVGLSFWLAVPISGVITAVFAGIVGYPGLRIKGAYFLIFMLSLNEFVRWLFTAWVGVFGGSSGISRIPGPDPIRALGITIDFGASLVSYYYLTLSLCLVAVFVYFKIHRSRLGRVWSGMRQNEDLLASLGVSVTWQREICFVVSCLFAGLAGGLYASLMGTIAPDSFNFVLGIYFFLGVLVGGVATPVGPVVGTLFMTILSQFMREFKQLEPIVWGAILILVLLFMRDGLVSLPAMTRRKIKTLVLIRTQ